LVSVLPFRVVVTVTLPPKPFALADELPLVDDEPDVLLDANAELPPLETETLLDDDEPANAAPATSEKAAARTRIFFKGQTSNGAISASLERR
jgi:hypothetical protein